MRIPFFASASCILSFAAFGCSPAQSSQSAPSDAASGEVSFAPADTADGTASSAPSDAVADGGSIGDGTAAAATVPLDGSADGSPVLSITVSPLALTPGFAPSISDYYVQCATGTNSVTVTVTDANGPQTTSLDLLVGQEVAVEGQYWIRCLPPEFPLITITRNMGGPTPGYYLINADLFAAVLDTNGTPVWYQQAPGPLNVDSLAVGTLSFMPNSTSPFGTSLLSLFTVTTLATSATVNVSAVGGPTDAHELRLLPNGDHLLFTYPIESGVDLSGLQSFTSNETIADCEIQEVDPTGSLVWSWLGSEHVDPKQESLEPSADAVIDGGSVVDVFHCNSIDVDSTGNLLLSMRLANAVFYIDRSTSQILWKLGGTPYNKDGATYIQVVDDPEGTFSMQHDARFQPNGDVSMFDDHGGSVTGVARAVEYALDLDANTATVDWQFLGTAQSAFEGSFRRYPDGESVIGWGWIASATRVVTEVDPDGNDVLDIAFSGMNQSYRAVKVPLSQFDIGVLRATAGP